MKIWCTEYKNATYTDAAMRDVTRFRGLRYFSGISLGDRFPADATIAVRTKRAPTDFFKAGVFWIISTKLRKILEAYAVNAEYFAIRLEDKKQKPLPGEWYCFNPTLELDWFDWTKSQYVAEQNAAGQNFATKIQAIITKPQAMDSVSLALAKRTIPDLVAVSDRLAASIVEAGCTGLVFREPSEWRNPVNPTAP